MSRHFDSRASRFPKVTRGFPDAGCGLHRHRRGWLSDFGHEAAAVVAIGSVHLERRNHPTFEPHHLAVVRVARVPTDGEVATLPAIWPLRGIVCKSIRWHEQVCVLNVQSARLATQQLEHRLLAGVGLRQYRCASLLHDLVLGQFG